MSDDKHDLQTYAGRQPSDEPGNEAGEYRAGELPQEADETTGASPGTAQACDDLGLNSLAANLTKFGINPPGVN